MTERRPDIPTTWAKPLRSYRLRGRALSPPQQALFDASDRWAFPVCESAKPVAAIASHGGADRVAGGESGDEAPLAADPVTPVDLAALFNSDGRDSDGRGSDGRGSGGPGSGGGRRVAMEIGFGKGATTLEMAIARPDVDLIAVDVHRPGIAALLKGIIDHSLTNVRVAHGDAVEILSRQIAPGALDEVRVFFPDPWPKVHHHRRRLVNAEFAALVASRLRIGGRLHLATDWEHYAQQMRTVIAAEPSLDNIADTPEGFVPRPAHRPVTRFEEIGMAKGHEVFDLVAVRVE